ncbi:MAG: hypothetical protein LBQ75_04635 [Zoogloeaceae bacterium]|nr:hypothetical protein [Zoogloeaceae bacterium]
MPLCPVDVKTLDSRLRGNDGVGALRLLPAIEFVRRGGNLPPVRTGFPPTRE